MANAISVLAGKRTGQVKLSNKIVTQHRSGEASTVGADMSLNKPSTVSDSSRTVVAPKVLITASLTCPARIADEPISHAN